MKKKRKKEGYDMKKRKIMWGRDLHILLYKPDIDKLSLRAMPSPL